jgi:1-acyl-sn-glycerol-3-phosphate acyltransferase
LYDQPNRNDYLKTHLFSAITHIPMKSTTPETGATPQPFFPNSTYTTPPGQETRLHRLLLRSRIYYMTGFLKVLLRYREQALSGSFNTATWSRAAMDCFHLMEACGGIFNIAGLDKPRSVDGPVVFIANHMSTMETLILPALVFPEKNAIFVVKQQLRDLPLFGPYTQSSIAVTRKSPTDDFKQVMTLGAEKIAQGFSVIIFPQATRSTVFNPEKFNTLGVKLARRAKVPVIPVALKTDFWGTGALVKDFGPINSGRTIHVEYGQPISISGSGKEEHKQVVAFIKDRLLGWGGQSL